MLYEKLEAKNAKVLKLATIYAIGNIMLREISIALEITGHILKELSPDTWPTMYPSK